MTISHISSTAGEAMKTNPANPQPAVEAKREAKRIPMSVPIQRLAVPEIPGYHTHWFVGAARVQRAIQAGYEFVDPEEIDQNFRDVAGGEGGDMGSRVSVVAGADLDDGQTVRLYLMKLKNEFWDQDQAALVSQSEAFLQRIRAGSAGDKTAEGDYSNQYIPRDASGNKNVFRPRKLKS